MFVADFTRTCWSYGVCAWLIIPRTNASTTQCHSQIGLSKPIWIASGSTGSSRRISVLACEDAAGKQYPCVTRSFSDLP